VGDLEGTTGPAPGGRRHHAGANDGATADDERSAGDRPVSQGDEEQVAGPGQPVFIREQHRTTAARDGQREDARSQGTRVFLTVRLVWGSIFGDVRVDRSKTCCV